MPAPTGLRRRALGTAEGAAERPLDKACQTVLLTSLLRSRPEAWDEQEEDER